MNHSVMKRRRAAKTAGFSMVEIAIAIGVLAFAMIPLIALLPHGQDTLRLAIREANESRIEQELLGRLNSMDWGANNTAIDDMNNTTWYFNDYGRPVEDPKEALFTLFLEVAMQPLPGATSATADKAATPLRTVTMKITDLPAATQPFNYPNRHRRFVATIVKMDK